MTLRSINLDFELHRVEAPSAEDVAAAVKQLDGKERTLVTLEVNDDHHMGVGGGDGHYVVYMTSDNLRFKNLVIPGKTGPTVMVTCGGVGGHSEGRKSGRVSLGLMVRFAAARSLASLAR